MKICWDNIEDLHLTKNGKLRNTKKNKTYDESEEPCIACGEFFLTRSDIDNKTCDLNCTRKTDEYKKTLSESRTGEKNSFWGKKHTDETKEKISKSRKGKHFPKLSEAMKGKKMPKGKDSSCWKGFKARNVSQFDIHSRQLEPIEETRRNSEEREIMEVRCTYCNNWFIPKLSRVNHRIQYLKGNKKYRESRFYCSDQCEKSCSIFNQKRYPKGFKINTSREVQSELRKICFERDEYTCIKCGKHKDELNVALHCHHIEGIKWEPLESADLDMVVTVCETCHRKIHSQEGCKTSDMQCKN